MIKNLLSFFCSLLLVTSTLNAQNCTSPTPVSSISQQLVSNTCGERVYRYTAWGAFHATSFEWSLPESVGGVSGVTVDSGNVLTSKAILVRYASNNAAFDTDSIAVRAFNSCSSAETIKFMLTNKALFPSTTPRIRTTNLVTNVCGARKVRYSITLPSIPSNTVQPEWDFLGSVLGANAQIDSGTVNSSTIVVLYTSNFGAVTEDSVRVRLNYNNGCAYSSYSLSKIGLGFFNPPPAAVTSIAQQLVSNDCGGRVYRYIAWGAVHATGFEWTLPESVGGVSGVTVDSGDVATSKAILVRYASNNAALITDSISVRPYNVCFTANTRKFRLRNIAAWSPLALPVSEITVTDLITDQCGARKVRYSIDAPDNVTSGAVQVEWDFVGSVLGANAQIDSGTVNSPTIVVLYTSNLGAAEDDSVRVRYNYNNGCSYGSYAKKEIALPIISPQVTAVESITQELVDNSCGARIYRYTANGASYATGYEWTLPESLGGVSGVAVDSGDIATSNVIRIRYQSNNAALESDVIQVRAYNCFNGEARSFTLTNTAWTELPLPQITATNLVTNECFARKVRYSIAVPSTSSGLVTPEWSFVGSVLGANAAIDSGTVNSTTIVVLFTSNLAAVTNDSVRVRYNYNNGCSYSAIVRRRISLTAFNAPVTMVSSISQQLVSNTCGARVYRYTANGARNFTGFAWTLPESVGGVSGVTVDSGNIATSRVIRVRYESNNAALSTDSIRVRAYNLCYSGENRSVRLTNRALLGCNTPPPPPALISSTPELVTFGAKVFPNPSKGAFNLQLTGSGTEEVEVRVMDLQGRAIKQLRTAPKGVITLGADLQPAVYLIEVRQGANRQLSRVIKL